MKSNLDKMMEYSAKVMKGGEKPTQAEIRVSRRDKALRFLTGPYRYGLNLGWQFLIWITCMAGWLLLPCAGVIFAGMVVEAYVNTGTVMGQYAALGAYAVGIIAGCKAARDAGHGIKQQFGGIQW